MPHHGCKPEQRKCLEPGSVRASRVLTLPLTTCNAADLAFTAFRVLQKAAGSLELLALLNPRECMQARGCLWLEAVEPCTVRKALTPRCDGTVKAIEKVRNSQLDLSRICELMSVLDVPRGCNEMTECAMARVSQKRATICLIRRQKVCYTKQSHGRQAGGPLPSQIAYSADASMSEAYWTVSSGKAERTGYSCRECRKVICKGETMKVREGRKLRFYYHEACFSGELGSFFTNV